MEETTFNRVSIRLEQAELEEALLAYIKTKRGAVPAGQMSLSVICEGMPMRPPLGGTGLYTIADPISAKIDFCEGSR